MLFSYKQLGRLVDLSTIDVKTLVNRLTFSGFEVEGVETLASASNLVIGHILTCVPHPDSTHLHLLTVDCGKELGVLNIVCGAPNAREGLHVIVALPGCVLPALNTTIAKGMIRGHESNGMCCSLAELGVDKSLLSEKQTAGIEELKEDAPVGERNVLAYLGLDDTILDINVLANRPDCLSYYGMAREIASLFSLAQPDAPVFKDSYGHQLHSESKSQACVRFDAIKVKGVRQKKETPEYIRRTLEANGIRSLSPIVDLGNYSMLLSGQPLNMYDAKKNPSDNYVVVDDYQGKFTAFDGKEFDLIPGDLVITDGAKPLCLGGIMAGDRACVDDSTQDIVIEAADFYHANIRHTANRLGLSSPSQQLFAKGRNPRMIPEALAITIALLPEFFEEYTVTDYSTFDSSDKEIPSFRYSLKDLNKRLGTSYTEEEVQKVFDAYGIKEIGNGLVQGPVFRVDLLEQCDIDEEVFRYYAADKVVPSLKDFPLTHGGENPQQKQKRAIRELLVAHGLDEILSFTLINEKQDASIRIFDHNPSYRVINPMTKDHEIVRSDLLPSMLDTINYNVAHQHENLALFEVSNVDTKDGRKIYLSIGLRGKKSLAEGFMATPYDFFDLKGLVEAIFVKLGIPETRYRLEYTKNEVFHPKAAADIVMGKKLVGTFGQLHPSFSADKIFLCELDLGYLLDLKGGKTKFTSYSSFPVVHRDLSFKLNDKVDYATLKKTILHTKDSYVKGVELFDDFLDRNTGEHYLGVSVSLGKDDGTLKDAEINSALNAIINNVKGELGLTLRGE